jgi:esterase/lipase superfamily enzyme
LFVSLSNTIKFSDDKEALIFIHGYRTKFDEAARRTAQLAWDLQFQGVPILYSRPSSGNMLYTGDEPSALWAVPHLKAFLQLVAQRSGTKTIHIVAHSLGNRALMYALQQISQDQSSTAKFHQIVLAAPDIDVDIFRQLASSFPSTADHVTIYASSHDRALALSKFLHQSPSMGGQPQLPSCFGTSVDLIDASVTSDDLFSLDHSYYAGDVAVLEDMAYVIRAGLPPEKRLLLDPHPSSGLPLYWTFRH